MGQKSVSEYRSMVRRQARTKAGHTIGGRGRVFTIVVSILAFVVVSHPTTVSALLMNTAIIGAVIFAVIYVVLYLWFFGREPVVIHNEQALEIEQLEAQKNALIEDKKPKLELKFDINSSSSAMRGGGIAEDGNYYTTSYRVLLSNKSNVADIEQIEVMLEEINAPFDFLPARLGIMNGGVTRLTPLGYCLVDVVTVSLVKKQSGETEYNIYFGFADDGPKLRQQAYVEFSTSYRFTIVANGSGTTPVCKTFELEFDKQDMKTPYEFREVNDAQAEIA